jgi:hypothetical protein
MAAEKVRTAADWCVANLHAIPSGTGGEFVGA